MTNYRQQLDRLKRHYEVSLSHFDTISFLDLAHSLRIWTEIKKSLDDKYSDIKIKKWVTTKKLKKTLTGAEFVYTYLPEGITIKFTPPLKQTLAEGPSIEKGSIGTLLKIEDNHLTLAQYMIIYRSHSREEVSIQEKESKNVPLKDVSYSNYMESPAIYFSFRNQTPRFISNEELIKRVANEYEASHANNSDTNFELKNIYSQPVRRLMEYRCINLPLPYFVLLHTAKTIIMAFDNKL